MKVCNKAVGNKATRQGNKAKVEHTEKLETKHQTDKARILTSDASFIPALRSTRACRTTQRRGKREAGRGEKRRCKG